MVYYFAYGSNMNWDDLNKWCEEHGYSPIHPGSNVERGVIKNYRLIFNHWSRSRNGGALNIVRSVGDEVRGVLFALEDKDFQKIKEKEGPAYKLFPVNVILANGKVVGAKTFKAKNSRELFPPTNEYLEIVLAGTEYFDLGERCLKQIKKVAQQAKTIKS